MFGVTGTLLNFSTGLTNEGKVSQRSTSSLLHSSAHSDSFCIFYTQRPRYNLDRWDEMMMKRDELLTGHARKQSVSVPVLCRVYLLGSDCSFTCTQDDVVAPKEFKAVSVFKSGS
jgi:hypothetical protein